MRRNFDYVHIDWVECKAGECFEHCSNDKVDSIDRWCKQILNNDEQYDEKNVLCCSNKMDVIVSFGIPYGLLQVQRKMNGILLHQ